MIDNPHHPPCLYAWVRSSPVTSAVTSPRLSTEPRGSVSLSSCACDGVVWSCQALTGGKGCFTQWGNGEFIVITEAIHPHFTQWVNYDYFSNVPTNLPTF